jgi:hypothetical protein
LTLLVLSGTQSHLDIGGGYYSMLMNGGCNSFDSIGEECEWFDVGLVNNDGNKVSYLSTPPLIESWEIAQAFFNLMVISENLQ